MITKLFSRSALHEHPDPAQRAQGVAALPPDSGELALGAERAELRLDAAEHVRSAEGLRKLASAAKDKDRGVTRLARQRLAAIAERAGQASEADAIVEQLQASRTARLEQPSALRVP